MSNNEKKYPFTILGLYKNDYAPKFVLNSMAIDQQRADEMCAAIQACVGGALEVREWGGLSKTGKKLPGYKLEGLTAEMVAERKAFGAQQKAQREAQAATHAAGDDAL
jgi:hypothetical protein